MNLHRGTICLVFGLALLAGCATPDRPTTKSAPQRERRAAPERPALKGPAAIEKLIPARVADRRGWADDIHAAMLALQIEPSAENVCAVIAVTEQESSFRVDPAVPGLAAMARRELDRLRENAGIPKVLVEAALKLPSSDGRSYNERIDGASTERQLSDIFEDFSGRVPLGKRLLADRNPVRTGGPMQVSITFAQLHTAARPYPWGKATSLRDEVFSRRGGLYFGIAHLFDYPAPYDDVRYRFADYNAGRFASRNAAFQSAVSELTGTELDLDGDPLRYENGRPIRQVSRTETVVRTLASHLEMTPADIRADLERAQSPDFEKTRLYLAVFTLLDGVLGKPAPRAVMPTVVVESFKTPRRLTTASYAMRVAERHKSCLAQL